MIELERQIIDIEADKPREECGVFGVFAPGKDVSQIAYLGAEALQHRGQDAAGIGTSYGNNLFIVKDTGLVSEVFTKNQMAALRGRRHAPIIATAHTRYSTSRGDDADDFNCVMPIYKVAQGGREFALSANGNFILHEEDTSGSASDTSFFAERVAEAWTADRSLEDAIAECLNRYEGAACLVVQTADKLIAARDSHGYRPLELGRLIDGGYVVASETTALDVVDAEHIREIEPGEIVTINQDGVHSRRFADADPKICAFEFIYNALPSSRINGISVNQSRRRMGALLAAQCDIDADMVIGVPESGISAAMGYAQASGIPYEEGLQKNRYITRTFIKANQLSRDQAVGLKFRPLKDIVEGKRLIVVDDSIVRGTTARTIGQLLYSAGASEVHLQSSSPPYAYPCFYGMDTGRPEELLVNQMPVEDMAEYLKVDSVNFLTVENLIRAIGIARDNLSLACMIGEYHTNVPPEVLRIRRAT